MKPSAEFNHVEFAKSLARIKAGTDGKGTAAPKFDVDQARELRKAAANGRKVEDYRVALEEMGFRFVPAEMLPRFENMQHQPEGLWRNERMRLAFTDGDVVSMFEAPAEFVKWIEKQKLQARMTRAGLYSPP